MPGFRTRDVSEPAGAEPLLPELGLVALVVPQRGDEGAALPAGAVGTVVGTLGDGAAYVVEFAEPFDDIATVRARDLQPAQ